MSRWFLPVPALVIGLLASMLGLGPWLGLGQSTRGAGAQTVTPAVPVTPFPRSIMGFVPADRVAAATAVDPALAVQAVAVAEGDGIGSEATRVVTVWFATPVTLPEGTYRVSVVFGDPDGTRTRASFLATDGEPTGGTVETSTDGLRWTSSGATEAALESDSLRITAAVGGADPGDGLWVEAQIDDEAARRSQSPVFSLDALLGRSTAGALPAATTGTLTSGTPVVADPLSIPGPPPTLTVDAHLTVIETEPVPATLVGQPVVNALDEITFMPGYTSDGTMPAVVQINRVTGAISALRGTTGLPTDRTGDGSFILQGLPAPPAVASPSTPSVVVLDLAGVASALDLPLDPVGLGIGLRRKLTLADGTDVIGTPTMATLVWYETASPIGPTETLAPTPTEEAADTAGSSSGTSVALLVGAAIVVLLAIGGAVLVVRRRRSAAVDRWLGDYSADEPGTAAEPDDPAATTSTRVDPPAATGPDPGLEWHTEPAVDPDLDPGGSAEELTIGTPPAIAAEPIEILTIDAPAAVAAEPIETLTIDVSPVVAEPAPEGTAPAGTTTGNLDETDDDRSSDGSDHRRSPADALAYLEAEVSALSERVDRIPDRRDDPRDDPPDGPT